MNPPELKTKLRGIHAYAVTPFKSDYVLDLEGLRQNIEFVAASGVHVIVVAGGTGEIFSLEPDEYQQVVRVAVQGAAGRVPVVAGVGFNSRLAPRMAREAESAGADGLLVMPPYFVKPGDDGVIAYVREIAEQVKLGLSLYSGSTLVYHPELVARLTEIPSVVGFKSEDGDVKLFERIRNRVGDRLTWICGMAEGEAHLYFSVGAEAVTSGIANFAPRWSLAVYEAAVVSDFATVRELIRTRVGPITNLRAKRPGYYTPVVKAAMDMLGLAGGFPRPPLLPILEHDRNELHGILKEMELL